MLHLLTLPSEALFALRTSILGPPYTLDHKAKCTHSPRNTSSAQARSRRNIICMRQDVFSIIFAGDQRNRGNTQSTGGMQSLNEAGARNHQQSPALAARECFQPVGRFAMQTGPHSPQESPISSGGAVGCHRGHYQSLP